MKDSPSVIQPAALHMHTLLEGLHADQPYKPKQ